MLEEYDGPLLGDEAEDQEGGGQTEECALDNNATISKYHPNKREKYDLLTLQGKKTKHHTFGI